MIIYEEDELIDPVDSEEEVKEEEAKVKEEVA